MINRRDALKLLTTASASTVLLPRAWSRPHLGGGDLTYGLLFGDEDLERIRSNFSRDPEFKKYREELMAYDMDALYAFIGKELKYNDQLYHIARLSRAAEEMAFLYAMTGNRDAARLATDAVEEIMKFERWDFFLDGDLPLAVQRASSTTVALCLVSDLLGDALAEQDRRRWLKAMGRKGCEPAYRTLHGIRHPQEVTGWRFDPESTFFDHRPGNLTDMNRRPEITRNTNLRAVPASALVLGALTYRLEFGGDAETERWLEMGTHGVEVFREFFMEDGSYDEETGYAHYTASHIQQAAIALLRHDGTDLMDIINWDGYVDFLLNMSMPTRINNFGVVNFGDSGNHIDQLDQVKRTSLTLWIAGYRKDSQAQWFGKNRGGHHNFWAVIWHDPKVKAEAPAQVPRLWVSDLDRVVARTGYERDDLVVAMRSGPPSNHEHADRNSIIVTCYGEELVTDPLRPPYSFADPSWAMRLTQGHSALLVDGQGHEHHNGVEGTNPSNSFARITRSESDDTHAVWVSDCTQPYRLANLEIKSVVRSIVVFYDQPAVIVVDQFAKREKPSTVQARFFGFNEDGALEQGLTSNGFRVKRPHAELYASVFSTTGHKVMLGRMDIAEERAAAHPFAEVATAPAMDGTIVTVLLPVRPGETPAQPEFSRSKSEVGVRVGGRSVRIASDELSVT